MGKKILIGLGAFCLCFTIVTAVVVVKILNPAPGLYGPPQGYHELQGVENLMVSGGMKLLLSDADIDILGAYSNSEKKDGSDDAANKPTSFKFVFLADISSLCEGPCQSEFLRDAVEIIDELRALPEKDLVATLKTVQVNDPRVAEIIKNSSLKQVESGRLVFVGYFLDTDSSKDGSSRKRNATFLLNIRLVNDKLIALVRFSGGDDSGSIEMDYFNAYMDNVVGIYKTSKKMP